MWSMPLRVGALALLAGAAAANPLPDAAVLGFVAEGADPAIARRLQDLVLSLEALGEFDVLSDSRTRSAEAAAGRAVGSCFDPGCAGEIGRSLAVDRVVTGRVTSIDGGLRLEIAVTEMASGAEVHRAVRDAADESALTFRSMQLLSGLREVLARPVGVVAPTPADHRPATPPPVVPAVPDAPPTPGVTEAPDASPVSFEPVASRKNRNVLWYSLAAAGVGTLLLLTLGGDGDGGSLAPLPEPPPHGGPP